VWFKDSLIVDPVTLRTRLGLRPVPAQSRLRRATDRSEEPHMGAPSTDPQHLARQLAGGRALFGAGMLVAPELTARRLGLDTGTARRVSWLTRMMAARDAVLGVGGLLATRPGGDAVPWLAASAACDATDALVVAVAVRQGRLAGLAPIALVPVAAGAAMVGAVTAWRLRRAC
jgi:hypothetical protein